MAEGQQNAPPKRITYTAEELIKLGRVRCACLTTTGIIPEMPFVTPVGTVSILLDKGIMIELTIDHAVRIVNPRKDVSIAVSSSGLSTSVFHPFGRLYQKGDVAEIRAYDYKRNARYAKLSQRGIAFSSTLTNVAYLVDPGGAHTTVESFSDLTDDVSKEVFISESSHGPTFCTAADLMLQSSSILPHSQEKTWIFGPVKIVQSNDGTVIVQRNDLYEVKTSVTRCTAFLQTKYIHFTANFDFNVCSHMFAKQRDQRIYYNPMKFVAKSAGQAAGFNKNGEFKLF